MSLKKNKQNNSLGYHIDWTKKNMKKLINTSLKHTERFFH